jgi:general secretion pathway protein D
LFSGSGQNSSQNQKGPTRQELVDQIIKLVTDTVSPDTWRDAGGSVGSLKELSGNLIVTQTPENQHSLVTLLEQLRESRAIQVTVETRFLIVQRNFLDDVGVDLNFIFNVNGKNSNVFGGPGGPGTAVPVLQQSSLFTALPTTGVPGSIGNLPTAATATGLSTAITYLDDFQVSLLLRATEVSTTSTTVTAPRITLFNGQRAYVLVATQKAYVSNLTAAVGTGASSFTPTVSVVQTGVLLDVAATVSADRKYVTLTLRPELSNLLDISDFTFQSSGSTNSSTVAASPVVVGGITAQAPTGTIQVPEIQLTELKTTVSVPDGGTLLLGGQTLAGETEKEAGVPVLSKIPFLKRLFTNRSMAKDEQILLILVKPTILIEKEIEQKQFPLLTSKLGT